MIFYVTAVALFFVLALLLYLFAVWRMRIIINRSRFSDRRCDRASRKAEALHDSVIRAMAAQGKHF